jgi:DNA-binding transcriptional ArsR family regulator
MITRGELEDTEKAFFKIIDEHTPYYQEVFQLLTGQRRRLFDILIAAGAPVTPKQIAERSRISDSTVVSQLRRLEKDGYVISRRDGRHTYYEVRERLFRLWREMRQPFGRKRVSILLEFLQLWYTPKERDDGGLTTATTRDTKQVDETSEYEERLLLSVGGYAEALDAAENIEDFVSICLKLALGELKAENIGNATRLMEMAYDAGTDREAGETDVLTRTMAFLKDVVASGEIRIIKTAVDEVIRLRGDRYRKLLKPLIRAIEIVETGDTKRYYSLQVEEREIVADIVREITGSDELCML